MRKIRTKVLKCTEMETGEFLIKLQEVNKTSAKTSAKFGMRPTRGEIYYAYSGESNRVGSEIKINLDEFDVVKEKFPIIDKKSGEEKILILNKLYLKELEEDYEPLGEDNIHVVDELDEDGLLDENDFPR